MASAVIIWSYDWSKCLLRRVKHSNNVVSSVSEAKVRDGKNVRRSICKVGNVFSLSLSFSTHVQAFTWEMNGHHMRSFSLFQIKYEGGKKRESEGWDEKRRGREDEDAERESGPFTSLFLFSFLLILDKNEREAEREESTSYDLTEILFCQRQKKRKERGRSRHERRKRILSVATEGSITGWRIKKERERGIQAKKRKKEASNSKTTGLETFFLPCLITWICKRCVLSIPWVKRRIQSSEEKQA